MVVRYHVVWLDFILCSVSKPNCTFGWEGEQIFCKIHPSHPAQLSSLHVHLQSSPKTCSQMVHCRLLMMKLSESGSASPICEHHKFIYRLRVGQCNMIATNRKHFGMLEIVSPDILQRVLYTFQLLFLRLYHKVFHGKSSHQLTLLLSHL